MLIKTIIHFIYSHFAYYSNFMVGFVTASIIMLELVFFNITCVVEITLVLNCRINDLVLKLKKLLTPYSIIFFIFFIVFINLYNCVLMVIKKIILLALEILF